MNHSINFIPSGRGKARCAPDLDYPHGKAMPQAHAITCFIELPYPAPECGMWEVHCEKCQSTVLVTAAGRPDDPVSFYMPCEAKNGD
jgi:hypothetical protein